jgi:hypothetical protein
MPQIVTTNRRRSRHEFEHGLIDTGVFNENRYFDVFVEYAKAAPEDVLTQINVCNRGPESAALHVLPTLWFRKTRSWGLETSRPTLRYFAASDAGGAIAASHLVLGECLFCYEGAVGPVFAENESNPERLVHVPNRMPFVKAGINSCIRAGPPRRGKPRTNRNEGRGALRDGSWARESRTIRLRLNEASAFQPRRPAPRNDHWHHMFNADIVSMPDK